MSNDHEGGTGVAVVPAQQPAMSMAEFVAGISTPAALAAAKNFANAYNAAVAALIGTDDVQVVTEWDQKAGRRVEKTFKKKSAWKKMARYFRISVVIDHVDRGFRPDAATGEMYEYADVTARGIAPWGQVAVNLASCDSREKRFANDGARTKLGHDILSTATTRACNRVISDLIAAGEVSAEEVEAGGGGQQEPRQQQARGRSGGQQAQRTVEQPEDVVLRFGRKHKDKRLGDIPTDDLVSLLEWMDEEAGKKEPPKSGEESFQIYRHVVAVLKNRDEASGGGDFADFEQEVG